VPVPIFHGIGGDNVTLATVIFTKQGRTILDNDKTFARIFFFRFDAKVAIANAKVNAARVRVVAVEGADFELLGADDVVVFVFHVVFLVTSKDTTKRGMHKRFLLFFLLGGCLREITYPGPPGLGYSPRRSC
jgi:hypothetical protein